MHRYKTWKIKMKVLHKHVWDDQHPSAIANTNEPLAGVISERT